MKLTNELLEALLSLMEGQEPEGFAERAMEDYGPGSWWARGDEVECPPDVLCGECPVEHCSEFAPPLFEMLAMTYYDMKATARKPTDGEGFLPL